MQCYVIQVYVRLRLQIKDQSLLSRAYVEREKYDDTVSKFKNFIKLHSLL